MFPSVSPTLTPISSLPLLEKSRQLEPTNKDILFGQGIYNYFAEVMPRRYPVIKPIMLLLPEPRPIVKQRQTRVTFWDQHVDLIAAAQRRPAPEARPEPQPDDAYRSHLVAA